MHMFVPQQAAILLLLKQILNRYPSARSTMLDFEDDSVGGGFNMTPATSLYRADVDDPQLANASST